MAEQNLIADGKVVVMHYTLRDADAEVIDSSAGGEPLAYLHGNQNIVPGLEKALTGKATGFKGNVVVQPAEGYGERVEAALQEVPRTAFPPQLQLQPGMELMARGPDGQQLPIWIAGVEGDKVMVDLQHPLAGATLHFEVEVVNVREATQEELSHGHPHGIDGTGGHHH